MSDLANLFDSSQGLPSAFRKDQGIGTVWAGKIVRASLRDVRDDDGNVKTWDRDGTPLQQVVIAIQTDQRDPEKTHDDGVRGIYIKMWGDQRTAYFDALKAQGVKEPEVGGMWAAQYIGDGPQPRDPKISPAKLFKYEYRKPTGLGGLMDGAAAATSPAAAAPPKSDPWANVPAPTQAPPEQPAPSQAVPPAGDPWGGASTVGTQTSTAWGQAPVPAPAQGSMLPPQGSMLPPPGAPAAPAPAPAAAAPGPATAPVDPMVQLTQVRALIGFGMTDAQIIMATGVNPDALVAIRSMPAA